jgi:hypothetical protein
MILIGSSEWLYESKRFSSVRVLNHPTPCLIPALREKGKNGLKMITCYLRYVIDPYKVTDFETYARLWIPLVNRFGGTHHGYFLPHEGANNMAVALFSFPSLAAYEAYRQQILTDEECQAAFAFAETTRCIFSYERTFLHPIFGDGDDGAEAAKVSSHA